MIFYANNIPSAACRPFYFAADAPFGLPGCSFPRAAEIEVEN